MNKKIIFLLYIYVANNNSCFASENCDLIYYRYLLILTLESNQNKNVKLQVISETIGIFFFYFMYDEERNWSILQNKKKLNRIIQYCEL